MAKLFSRTPRRARFESLCATLRPDVYRFAYWLARDRSVAEDVVQETFMRAWRSIDSLATDSAAKAWLLSIARREHARLYERKRFETVDIDELSGLEGAAPAAANADDLAEVRAAIFALDADYREPLVLQVLFGYSSKEIADLLGLTQGAVLTRLFRAREKLRATLSPAAEGES
jgi:RNA polymerase sigma-70 factor (ECF subfamily)